LGKEYRYFVYIMASEPYGTLYIGVTGNLAGRTHEHKGDLKRGFTSKYGVHMLVWFEEFSDVHDAILREKALRNGGAHGRLN
jgi:putative endonuclease